MSNGNPFEQVPAQPTLSQMAYRKPQTVFTTDSETQDRIAAAVSYTGEQLERVVDEGLVDAAVLNRFSLVGQKASIAVVASNDLPHEVVMHYHPGAHQISIKPDFSQAQITWGLLAGSGKFGRPLLEQDILSHLSGVILQNHPDKKVCDNTARAEREIMDTTYMLAGITRTQVSACFAAHGKGWQNDGQLSELIRQKVGVDLTGAVLNRVHQWRHVFLEQDGHTHYTAR